MFSNIISCKVSSGNITATISDFCQSFYLFLLYFKPILSKGNIYERKWSKSIQQNFVLDYYDKDWSNILQLDQKDVNHFINSFLDNINSNPG